MTNLNETLAERGSRYGSFEGHAELSQYMKQALLCSPAYLEDKLTDSMKEALEMIFHKIARILNGDPTYADSWHDIIGYTKLVENQLLKEAKQDSKG